MTPAQRYAQRFATWRERMPLSMRTEGTAYWLRHAHPKKMRRRSYSELGPRYVL